VRLGSWQSCIELGTAAAAAVVAVAADLVAADLDGGIDVAVAPACGGDGAAAVGAAVWIAAVPRNRDPPDAVN
jgi:hypothetical protein